jgi:hypothetical protein
VVAGPLKIVGRHSRPRTHLLIGSCDPILAAFLDLWTQGGFLNRPKNIRPPSLSSSLAGLVISLEGQWRRIRALSKRSATLETRGKHLLAKSNLLRDKFGQSSKNLTQTFVVTKTAVAELRLLGSSREGGNLTPREKAVERVVEDSPEMVEALQQATEILKLEFSDSEGSGRETLVKCEQVLQRTRRVWTIELPLA